ncbi:hypothetical protein [Aquimarina macrocephali]|uniref:hypothetical protein n=1 Tax=Aquimarina macrocephali TaxID=666563 RepID=UPI003F67DCE2
MYKKVKKYNTKKQWVKRCFGSLALPMIVVSMMMVFPQSDFEKLVRQTNYDLSQYHKLQEYKEYYALNDVGLTNKEIHKIKNSYHREDLSADKDSIIAYSIIRYYKDRIIDNLQKITNHQTFTKKDIMALLDDDLIKMVKSEDNKLFHFSFDAKVFGVLFREQVSILYYDDSDWSEHQSIRVDKEKKTLYEFYPNSYNTIDTINTGTGVKYVLIGHDKVRGNNFMDHISLYTYDKGKIVNKFNHSLAHEGDEYTIKYDKINHVIDVVYIPNRKYAASTDCYCDEDDAIKSYGKENKVQRCAYSFKFNGDTFEFVN